jgi:hypothetical protein
MLSRREWMGQLLALASMAGLSARGHAAQTPSDKITKEIAKYQDHPNNMQKCGMCKFYSPAGGKAGSGMMGGQMMSQDHMAG